MFYVECQKCVAILMITMYFFFPLTEAKRTDPSEVKALGDIRSNLNDPMKYLNWTKGDPCTSNWTGVSCYNTTHGDSYLHVQELQLLNMNLSGNLAPELGKLSYMEIMNFMWNKLSGIIPKQIGNIKSLKLLLLNGNELSGNLPEEIGNLLNLERLQIDENQISGSLPVSFANLTKVKHIHMNNNSINGQIPKEFSQLPNILFILLDNNNLSGDIPPELSMLSTLRILQLDNNNFNGASIPSSFGNMIALFKLSLRNCSLQGLVPDLSRITQLGYLDLSWNQLNGTIPPKQLSKNITTIDLSNNKLSGPVPENFSGLPLLQKLSLKKNILNGSVASEIWKVNFSSDKSLILDFQNNDLNSITGDVIPPSNVSIMLQGNPICENITQNIAQFCGPQHTTQSSDTTSDCLVPKDNCPVEDYFECNCAIKVVCVCQAPIEVGYRLKSPGISDFRPYTTDFVAYLTSELDLYLDQLYIDSYIWEEGPRLSMFLKIFPINSSDIFNETEILRIRRLFLGWKITYSDIFGPYEVLNFTPSGYYKEFIPTLRDSSSTLSKGAIVGIIVGIIAAAITSTAICSILVFRRKVKHEQMLSRKRKSITASRIKIKIDGVKDFTFKEISQATNNFSNSTIIGQGGYGIVYKGILHDGTEVAVKRAKKGSLQGSKEFYTEIELLSRLHHRNLVSLFGYCDEVGEQMLVYEFMSNSSLRDHLPAKLKEPLSFFMRLRIALGSAKGILYLHTEVNPPIFHRDIKPANILLDDKFTAKVADFGISRFAPELDAQGLESSHISTVVKGTPGYLDPEYFLTDTLTDKSDVYSLGIVFLELLTGLLPASHGRNIVREVNIACQSSGGAFSIIDKEMGDYPSDCVEKFLMLALRCCHDEPSSRPSMAEVVREVENIKLVYLEEHSIPSTSTNIETQTDIVSVTSSSVRTGVHSYSNYKASSLPNSDVHPVVPR